MAAAPFSFAAAAAYGSLADPPSTSVLAPAVSWLQGSLLGSAATAAAAIAFAAVGLMLLSGRIAVRPGLAALLGCFILFGAASIAAGIQAWTGGAGAGDPAAVVQGAAPPPPPPPLVPPSSAPAAAGQAQDPHAGASVPVQ